MSGSTARLIDPHRWRDLGVVFDGRATTQLHKQPAGHEIRVHELYGGTSRSVPLTAGAAELAERRWQRRPRLASPLAYASVDMVRWEGGWAVSELELIEPGLSLGLLPENAEAFADMVARRLT